MTNTIKTLELHTKLVENGKQKFTSSLTKIKDKWVTVKFTKDCKDIPTERGVYDLTVDLKNCSLQTGNTWEDKDGNSHPDNDILWVKKVEELRKYSDEELGAISAEQLLDYLK